MFQIWANPSLKSFGIHTELAVEKSGRFPDLEPTSLGPAGAQPLWLLGAGVTHRIQRIQWVLMSIIHIQTGVSNIIINHY